MIHRKSMVSILGAFLALMLGVVSGMAGSGYAGGHTRFVYQTETASGRVEIATTEIIPQGDGVYRVVTTTEDVVQQNSIRLSFFGEAAQSLGLTMSEDGDSPFDLSPLGALSGQILEPDKTYLLSDGWSLKTSQRVTVAGLAGVEAVFSHADSPEAIVRVVLADDLYIRQFLPFPLRVELEYLEAARMDSEVTPTATIVFSGCVELVEYAHESDQEGAS
ncbi:hypothetical protein IH601_12310 [Candidatus Bipolaricaulota bacterium]|jgi:hypothetical protein|nr:hypothetical protein [Candidatus Bipolaricaulota bacterium]TFH10689.1 MAG: hypothetical protein E4H08_03140 [Candidatus Atribacteria bacterium]